MVNPAAQRPRFLAPGDKLGKYELIRQIAVGGMAELYLSRTVGIEGFEKLVVVKRILPQFSNNASFVNMFLNEARLAATLHHPNIAQVYDIGQEGQEYFFAMEYIHGEDLGRMLATGIDSGVPLSLDVALTLVAGLCAGLHYAHEKVGNDGRPLAVVHRDVSPSNVLVSYDGAVKLVDFGIARAGSQPSTTRGGLKGKIGYMSPEQCRGKEQLDRRSDIFSVGALLFEMTTGQLPFTDETEYGVLNQLVNTDAPPPSSVVPSYPPALERIVMKALARDRDQRYATSIELQGDIEDFAHESRLRVSPLVLARLMGALFPARLEEWDHARAQGAFFVEQHVVRTLIESGKSSESGVAYPALKVPVGAESEDTSISAAPMMMGDNEPTNVQAVQDLQRPKTPPPVVPPRPSAPALPARLPPQQIPPRVTAPPSSPAPPQATQQMTPPALDQAQAPRQMTPRPIPRAPTPRPPTPVPNMPGAVPIVNAGMMVTPGGVYGGALHGNASHVNAPGDVTERVRIPTPVNASTSDPALMAQPSSRSRLPFILLGAAGVLGVVIATMIVQSGGGGPSARTVTTKPAETTVETTPIDEITPTVETPPATEIKPAEVARPVDEVTPEPAAVVTQEPVADPVKPVEPKVEPPTRPVKAAKVTRRSRPKAEPRPAKVEKPKPEPKPEVKEPAKWNADSPFMPVRPADKR